MDHATFSISCFAHIKSNQILRSVFVIVRSVLFLSTVHRLYPPPPRLVVLISIIIGKGKLHPATSKWSSFILFVEKNCHHYHMSSQLSKLVRIATYTNVYTRNIVNPNQMATLCRDIRIRLRSNRKFHLENFIWTYFLVSYRTMISWQILSL